VQAVSLAEVTGQLYALSPAEFISARDELAGQARAAGQRDVAAGIKKLARPTVSAWLVNQLVRAAPAQMSRLFELGEALQEAQRTLAGNRLRELSGQRRQSVAELLPIASELADRAGQPASSGVLAEVRATLEAAIADAEARAAVQSGQLTKALTYAGLGEVELSAALASQPPSPGGRGAKAGSGRKAESTGPAGAEHAGLAERADRDDHQADRLADAAQALRAAEAAVGEAAAAVEEAERQVVGVNEQRQFLRRRIDHLERELREATAADAQLALDGRQAQRTLDEATRAFKAGKRRLGQLQQQAAGPDS